MRDEILNREYEFDFLRTAAAFLVIVIHVAAFQFEAAVGSFNWVCACLYDCVAHVSVPLFFMISGKFLLDPKYQLTPQKLRKKIERLLLAYCVWSFVFVIRSNWENLLTPHWIAANFHMMLGQFITGDSHLWFIWTLIGLYLITPILRQIVRASSATSWFILLFLIFQVLIPLLKEVPRFGDLLSSINNTVNVKLVAGYTGYYVLGYWLYDHQFKKTAKAAVYLTGAVCLILIVLATLRSSYSENRLVNSYFAFLHPLMICASCAIYLTVVQRRSFFRKVGKNRAVFIISQYSFGIYLIHYSLVRILFTAGLLNWAPPALSIPINVLMVLAISLLLAVLIRKIPVIGKQIT